MTYLVRKLHAPAEFGPILQGRLQEDAVMLHGRGIFISLLWRESTRIVSVTNYLWLK